MIQRPAAPPVLIDAGFKGYPADAPPLTPAQIGAMDLRLGDDDPSGPAPQVGDRIALGISHPCTTFDKWRWMPVVDAITTRF